MTVVKFKVLGIEQTRTRMKRLTEAIVHSKPAMEYVATELLRIEGQTFQSQGRRGGGSWRKDSDAWRERKAKLGLDPRIGHATLALRRSMSVRGADHQILEITSKTINLGTDLPYAQTAQKNRPFVKLTKRDTARVRTIFRDYIMTAWRSPV